MQPNRKKPLNLATERVRQARLRERRKAEGWRRVTVWLTPEEAATLETLGDEWLGRTVKGLLRQGMERPPTNIERVDALIARVDAMLGQEKLGETTDEGQPPAQVPEPENFALALVPDGDVDVDQVAVSDTGREPPADLMVEVDSLLSRGLNGEAIAQHFNAQGWRTKRGAEFRGANLLRDWRKWKGVKE